MEAASALASVLTPDQPPLLTVRQLSYRWPDGRSAVSGCDLEIPAAGLWMLVGGNGSGKSTLLRLLAGLLTPAGGSINSRCRTALVFQNPDHQLLLPSCGTDLQLWLPAGASPQQNQQRVRDALALVGLAGLEERPIHSLSGGQKQRLAIAGAVASGAGLLLLDEPTALLDPVSQNEILDLIHTLCHRREHPLAALWVTHRLEELARCDGAARMDQGRAGPWQNGHRLQGMLEQQAGALPQGGAKR